MNKLQVSMTGRGRGDKVKISMTAKFFVIKVHKILIAILGQDVPQVIFFEIFTI